MLKLVYSDEGVVFQKLGLLANIFESFREVLISKVANLFFPSLLY